MLFRIYSIIAMSENKCVDEIIIQPCLALNQLNLMLVGFEAGNYIYFYVGFHNFLDVESWFF